MRKTAVINQLMLYDELSKFDYSPSLYISGFRALNTQDYEYNTGDWHNIETWFHPQSQIKRYNIVGVGQELDTTPYLSSRGVFESSELFGKMGIPKFAKTVYCATHARAIADLVIAEAFFAEPYNGTKLFRKMQLADFDDFMCSPADKQRVYDLLEIAIPKLPEEQASHVSEWLRLAKEKNYDL